MNDIRDFAPTGKEVFEHDVDDTPVLKAGDEVIEGDASLEVDRYQVVRREFFAHLHEPTISFDRGVLHLNAACIKRFPNVEFVQILINKDKKVLALKPCSPSMRDSFSWKRITGKGKIVPRNVTCRLFYAMLVELMNWNPNDRYKLLGRIVHANGEYLIVFDLNATEVYERSADDAGKEHVTRTPAYPADWKNQFGTSYKEHRENLQVDIFDGYAVFTIQDPRTAQGKEEKANDSDNSAEAAAGHQEEPDTAV